MPLLFRICHRGFPIMIRYLQHGLEWFPKVQPKIIITQFFNNANERVPIEDFESTFCLSEFHDLDGTCEIVRCSYGKHGKRT